MAQEPKKEDGVRADSAQLSEDIARLKNDVHQITQTLEKLLGDGAASAKDSVRTRARQARAGAARAQEAAEEGLDDAVTYARSTIAERPMGAVTAALGLGVVLGLLLRRR